MYGRDDAIGVQKRLAQTQYRDQYDQLVADGVLQEKIINDKVFVTHSAMATGREWGTEEGSDTHKQKNIFAYRV